MDTTPGGRRPETSQTIPLAGSDIALLGAMALMPDHGSFLDTAVNA